MYDFQRANMWKRISAALLDLILMVIAVVGFALLLATVLNYESYHDRLTAAYDEYEEIYGVSLDMTAEEYEKLPEPEKALYNMAVKEFSVDQEVNYVYRMMFNFTLLITIFSFLFGYLLLEFFVPLIFKNGQTLGKKVFGIALMREDGVRITPFMLFARTVLGKYTIETMFPVLILTMIYFGVMGIVGTIAVLGLWLFNLILLFATRAHTPIHDKMAHTVAVDMASQMIFDSPEALLEYKKRIHAESVEDMRS